MHNLNAFLMHNRYEYIYYTGSSARGIRTYIPPLQPYNTHPSIQSLVSIPRSSFTVFLLLDALLSWHELCGILGWVFVRQIPRDGERVRTGCLGVEPPKEKRVLYSTILQYHTIAVIVRWMLELQSLKWPEGRYRERDDGGSRKTVLNIVLYC